MQAILLANFPPPMALCSFCTIHIHKSLAFSSRTIIIIGSFHRSSVNLFIALIVLVGSPKEPQVYYFSGKNLTKLRAIELPNIGQAALRFFVHSPSELLAASIDSSEVELCIPLTRQRKNLKLRGRWYIVTWYANLNVGAERHRLCLSDASGHKHVISFEVEVEGTRKLTKPKGLIK